MAFNESSYILVACCICLGAVYGADYLTQKPDFMISCRINEPEFTKCSTKSVQIVMDHLAKGIPELSDVIDSWDPISLDNIIFKQDNNDVATIRANLTNLSVIGFSKLKIKESRVSKKDFSWETKIFLPYMRLDGKYKMKGKILIIPLNGAGNMFIEIENMNILMHSKTRLYEKGGYTFYNVTDIKVDLDIRGLKTNFDNIFNGNSKEVERSTNEFFNENWRDFYEALKPIILQTVERTLQKILQQAFHKIPANFLVEDIPTSKQLYGNTH